METQQQRTLDAGRRVQVFLDTFAAIIGTLISALIREKLDASIAALAGFRLEQTMAFGLTEGERVNQLRLKTELYDRFVLPIVRVAPLVVADAPQYPNLIVRQSVIRSVDFVPTIRKFREAVAAHEEVLETHVMQPDFLGQLDADLAAVEASSDLHSRQLARRKAATEGCDDSARTVRGYIGVIDALLRQLLKSNPSLLRDWKASKSIPQTPVHPLPTGSLEPLMDGSVSTTDTDT